MLSTDIDDTPILVLTAIEVEYVSEMMEEIEHWPDAVRTSAYLKMQKFLMEPGVQTFLAAHAKKVTDAIFEDLKRKA